MYDLDRRQPRHVTFNLTHVQPSLETNRLRLIYPPFNSIISNQFNTDFDDVINDRMLPGQMLAKQDGEDFEMK